MAIPQLCPSTTEQKQSLEQKAEMYAEEVVGKRIRFYLSPQKVWVPGFVRSYDNVVKKHFVQFDNRCEGVLELDKEEIEWVSEEETYGEEVVGRKCWILRNPKKEWCVGVVISFDSTISKHWIQYDYGFVDLLQLDNEQVKWVSEKDLYREEVVGKRVRVYSSKQQVWVEGCVMSYNNLLRKHSIRFDHGEDAAVELDNEQIEWVHTRSYGEEVVGKIVKIYRPNNKGWFQGRVLSFDRLLSRHWVQYDCGGEEVLRLENEQIKWVFGMEKESHGEALIGKRIRIYRPGSKKIWDEGCVLSFDYQLGKHIVQYVDGSEIKHLQLEKENIKWISAKKMYKKEVVGMRIKVYKHHKMAWYEGTVCEFHEDTRKHWVRYDLGEEDTLKLEKEKIVWMCVRLYREEVVGKKVRVQWPLVRAWQDGRVKEFDWFKERHYVRYDDGKEDAFVLENERIEWIKAEEFYEEEVVGKRLRIFSCLLKGWYEGCVKSYDKLLSKHLVLYDNGKEEHLQLDKENIWWVEKEVRKFPYLIQEQNEGLEKGDSYDKENTSLENEEKESCENGLRSTSQLSPSHKRKR